MPDPGQHHPKDLKTPVALFVFNRLDQTRLVFEAIRKAGDRQLFVFGDGPREGVSDDDQKCSRVREFLETHHDAEGYTSHFSDKNLGCRRRLVSGLRMLFDMVPEAIILEDDCLPSPGFFEFADAMLTRYRDETSVFHVSGHCPIRNKYERSGEPYWVSRYPHIWGWATWANRWSRYDENMKEWRDCSQRERAQFLKSVGIVDRHEQAFWTNTMNRVSQGGLDTWDIQWVYCCLKNRAVSVTPGTNLVRNIGFGLDATHTSDSNSSWAKYTSEHLCEFERHYPSLKPDASMDQFAAIAHFGRTPRFPGLRFFLRRLLKAT